MFGFDAILQLLTSIDSKVTHLDQQVDDFRSTLTRLETLQKQQATDISTLKVEMEQVRLKVTQQQTINRVVGWGLGILLPALIGLGIWFVEQQIVFYFFGGQ